MATAFLIYFIIGILLSFVGPLAKNTNDYISKFKEPSLLDAMVGAMSKRKKIIAEVLIRIMTLLFYPLFLVLICIDFFRSKSIMKVQGYEPIDNNLYYSRMGGAGIIKCNVCDFNEEITSFLHGFPPDNWSSSGYQCQNCGKFDQISDDLGNSNVLNCECGGDLDREKPLFCPKCKTNDLSYRKSYIT